MARNIVEERERQRLRRVTPANAGKVVSKDIYWTVPFLHMFLERCDELGFDVPAGAHRMALHAPSLARMIGVGDRPGEYTDEIEKRSFEVLAIAILAGLSRRVGQAEAARSYYAQAFEICQREVTPKARAELYSRYGNLRTALKETDAVEYLDKALSLFESIGDANGAAQTRVLRGMHFGLNHQPGKAIVDFAAGVETSDRREARGKRIFAAALTNLAYEVSANSGHTIQQAAALDLLTVAKEQFQNMPSRLKYKILWVEGLLYRNLHFGRRAIQLLRSVRKRIRRQGDPFDFALISLDLALVSSEEGELGPLKILYDETMAALPEMSDSPEFLQILGQWKRSMRAPVDLRSIKEKIEALRQL